MVLFPDDGDITIVLSLPQTCGGLAGCVTGSNYDDT
jgi:hypothetical protein